MADLPKNPFFSVSSMFFSEICAILFRKGNGVGMNYYEILGIGTDCGFASLKKAYYRKARECHPDRFGGDPEKTEQFKQLVEAFVTLSDPEKRRLYDSALRPGPHFTTIISQDTIMDTDADDTLEELIVGNDPPAGTTLFTFFSDLEKTLVFMTSREARDCFEKRKFRTAARLYERLVVHAPVNILYRVYLARCLTRLKKYRQAAVHYKAALTVGRHRDPPQHLLRVQYELKLLNRKRLPFWTRLRKFFQPDNPDVFRTPEDEMIAAAEREMARMLSAEKKLAGQSGTGRKRLSR